MLLLFSERIWRPRNQQNCPLLIGIHLRLAEFWPQPISSSLQDLHDALNAAKGWVGCGGSTLDFQEFAVCFNRQVFAYWKLKAVVKRSLGHQKRLIAVWFRSLGLNFWMLSWWVAVCQNDDWEAPSPLHTNGGSSLRAGGREHIKCKIYISCIIYICIYMSVKLLVDKTLKPPDSRPLNLGEFSRGMYWNPGRASISIPYETKDVSFLKLQPLGNKIPVWNLNMITSKFGDLLFQRVSCLFSEVYPSIFLVPQYSCHPVTHVPVDDAWMTRMFAPKALSTHHFQGIQWDVRRMCWASQAAGSKYHQRSQGTESWLLLFSARFLNGEWWIGCEKRLMNVSCNGFVGGLGGAGAEKLNSFPSGFFLRLGSTTTTLTFQNFLLQLVFGCFW